MRFDPQDPIWPNRDRFVLSNGHASMLLWSVLYLTGTRAVNAEYERLGSRRSRSTTSAISASSAARRPGIRNIILVSGVEATTGPLGQGIATSVGMAIARKWLGSRYNKPGFELFDYNIYAICGDGCMMEGVGSEAASLAGHLGLDDLCWIYDNNHITIEGKTSITFTEDVAARFLAYQWNVLRVGDANDLERIEEALAVFRKTKGRPTLIILDSQSATALRTRSIPRQPMASRWAKTRSSSPSAPIGWPENAKFLVPDGVMEHFADGIGQRGGKARALGSAVRQVPRAVSRSSPPRSTRCSGASCRPDGIAICRAFRRIQGDRRTRCVGPSAQCPGPEHSLVHGRSADLGSSNRTTLKFGGAGDFEPGLPKAAIFISASASTPWRRSSTGCRCRSCGRSVRHSSSSATTHGRRFGSPRSWSCRPSSFSPMTPWATAKMDRRISRSSS